MSVYWCKWHLLCYVSFSIFLNAKGEPSDKLGTNGMSTGELATGASRRVSFWKDSEGNLRMSRGMLIIDILIAASAIALACYMIFDTSDRSPSVEKPHPVAQP